MGLGGESNAGQETREGLQGKNDFPSLYMQARSPYFPTLCGNESIGKRRRKSHLGIHPALITNHAEEAESFRVMSTRSSAPLIRARRSLGRVLEASRPHIEFKQALIHIKPPECRESCFSLICSKEADPP